MRAIASAWEHSLVALLVEALAILARILNELGEYTAVGNLAEAALPHVCALVFDSVLSTNSPNLGLGNAEHISGSETVRHPW